MSTLALLLPGRRSPLLPNGKGLQSVHLTHLPGTLAAALVDLIGVEARGVVVGRRMTEEAPLHAGIGLVMWEEHEMDQLRADTQVTETMRQAVVQARRGQGPFKERATRIERACRITGAGREEPLRASHCKPWRDASNEEQLDGENGLLLTPSADHLFDRGFVGFDDNGGVLISPVAHPESPARMGLDLSRPRNVGKFAAGQRHFLEFHRENVLLRSRFLEAS